MGGEGGRVRWENGLTMKVMRRLYACVYSHQTYQLTTGKRNPSSLNTPIHHHAYLIIFFWEKSHTPHGPFCRNNLSLSPVWPPYLQIVKQSAVAAVRTSTPHPPSHFVGRRMFCRPSERTISWKIFFHRRFLIASRHMSKQKFIIEETGRRGRFPIDDGQQRWGGGSTMKWLVMGKFLALPDFLLAFSLISDIFLSTDSLYKPRTYASNLQAAMASARLMSEITSFLVLKW